MSIMYPTIFALGVKDLGPKTKLGGSFIVMALAGGAIMPPLLGYVARQTGSYALGYLVPVFGFVAVALYAFCGSQFDNSRARQAVSNNEARSTG